MSGRLGIKLCVWSQVLCEFQVLCVRIFACSNRFRPSRSQRVFPRKKPFSRISIEFFRPSVYPFVKAKTCFHNCQLFLVYIPLYFLLFSLNLLLSFYMNIAAHFCLPHWVEFKRKKKQERRAIYICEREQILFESCTEKINEYLFIKIEWQYK